VAAGIVARGRTPLLVGGTMLYFRAFLEGLAELPAADPALRAGIEQQATRFGWPHVHARLAAVDPESAARIHPNHSQRLSRALEVYLASGIPLSSWHRRPGPLPAARQAFEVRQLAIAPAERPLLHRRIEQRLQRMMQAGLLDEVRRLHRREDLHPGLPALRSVGYRQLWQFLDGECSLEEALERAAAATRQLARRQLTWLRKWPDLLWIHTDYAGNVVNGTEAGESAKLRKSPLEAALNYLGCDTM
jgi:tRNA dimethylallyltransferase